MRDIPLIVGLLALAIVVLLFLLAHATIQLALAIRDNADLTKRLLLAEGRLNALDPFDRELTFVLKKAVDN